MKNRPRAGLGQTGSHFGVWGCSWHRPGPNNLHFLIKMGVAITKKTCATALCQCQPFRSSRFHSSAAAKTFFRSFGISHSFARGTYCCSLALRRRLKAWFTYRFRNFALAASSVGIGKYESAFFEMFDVLLCDRESLKI